MPLPKKRSVSTRHCCAAMRKAVTLACGQHADGFECPDVLIYHSAKTSTYGIIIHDGGSSFSNIAYCPWCGKALQANRGRSPQKHASVGSRRMIEP